MYLLSERGLERDRRWVGVSTAATAVGNASFLVDVVGRVSDVMVSVAER